MSDIDWAANAVVHSRSDHGSDLHFHFATVAEGPLAEMVRKVAAMPSDERARLVMDVRGRGNLDVDQIMALAAREDLPTS